MADGPRHRTDPDSGGPPCAGGGVMKENRIKALHQRWELLRLYRYRGSFPVAYRILRNYIRKAGASL